MRIKEQFDYKAKATELQKLTRSLYELNPANRWAVKFERDWQFFIWYGSYEHPNPQGILAQIDS